MTTATITREDAAYRVALKRALRVAGTDFSNNDSTPALEALATGLPNHEPVGVQIDHVFRRAAQAWEDGNNSGNNRELSLGYAECDFWREVGKRLAALFGLGCSFPGLYPAFHDKRGYTHHGGAVNALRWARED